MSDLFSSIEVGAMTMANRFVRSATHDWMADDDGTVSDSQVELYRKLGAGGLGLIVTGHAYVRRDGKCSVGMTGIDEDRKIPGLSRIARAVHESGNARAVVQINFGGAQMRAGLQSGELLAPSPRDDVPQARAFTADEALELVDAYAQAARRAREAGFDGVQLHGAHGYFLNQTLSPLTNRREDEYGGETGRTRLARAIAVRVKELAGRDFPLLIKIASHDRMPGGLSLEESVAVTRELQDLGLDAVEVSGGMRPGMNTRKPLKPENEGFFLEEAGRFKAALSIPVICVHGFRSLSRMQAALASGKTDMISLCRPLIREPDLVRRLQAGEAQAATCISCNRCMKEAKPLRCWED